MFQIIQTHGHYEIYYNGNFVCSADSWSEVESEVKSYQQENCISEI